MTSLLTYLRVLIAAILILVSPSVWASSVNGDALVEARTLFVKGDYDEAHARAAALGTSEAYLLASEAIAAKIILGYYDKPNQPARQARDLAEKAVALNPDNLDARFHHAVTFGLETQSTGVLKAWRKKMPTRMREEIETLRALAPNDPRGHALLGAWHLGIVNRVGERNAYSWYKASTDRGIALYEKAMELAGEDILIASNYAASTILLGNPDYAQTLMLHVAKMTPRTAPEKEVQSRMDSLLALYDEPRQLKRAAKKFLRNERF